MLTEQAGNSGGGYARNGSVLLLRSHPHRIAVSPRFDRRRRRHVGLHTSSRERKRVSEALPTHLKCINAPTQCALRANNAHAISLDKEIILLITVTKLLCCETEICADSVGITPFSLAHSLSLSLWNNLKDVLQNRNNTVAQLRTVPFRHNSTLTGFKGA